jgi:hypothetical protein
VWVWVRVGVWVWVWVRVWVGSRGEGRGTCDESKVKQPSTLITECHSCSRWSTACGLRGRVGA